MDSARRIDAAGTRARHHRQSGLRLSLTVAALAAVACSGIADNNDGIASLELRYPATTFLEAGSSVQLSAVALDRNGTVVESAALRWRTPDTTVTVGENSGLVESDSGATGTARIQVGVFGSDTIATSLAGLTITLTGRVDSVQLMGDDSLTVATDNGTASFQVRAAGGNPPTGIPQRPITARIIDPVPVDSPTVVFQSGRVNDSLMTASNGIATFTIRNLPNRPVPDRAVVQFRARRSNGQEIPGSGRTLVVRFLHQ